MNSLINSSFEMKRKAQEKTLKCTVALIEIVHGDFRRRTIQQRNVAIKRFKL